MFRILSKQSVGDRRAAFIPSINQLSRQAKHQLKHKYAGYRRLYMDTSLPTYTLTHMDYKHMPPGPEALCPSRPTQHRIPQHPSRATSTRRQQKHKRRKHLESQPAQNGPRPKMLYLVFPFTLSPHLTIPQTVYLQITAQTP